MFCKGDIVLIPFPFTDLSGSKVRPAVLLAQPKQSGDILVAFITSKTKPNTQHAVLCTPDQVNGLKVPSAILCDKIATLDIKVVVGKIGTCDDQTVVKIDVELKQLFGL